MNSVDRNNYSVFDPKNSKTKIVCWSSWCSGLILTFERKRVALFLSICWFNVGQMGSDMLHFVSDFF